MLAQRPRRGAASTEIAAPTPLSPFPRPPGCDPGVWASTAGAMESAKGKVGSQCSRSLAGSAQGRPVLLQLQQGACGALLGWGCRPLRLLRLSTPPLGSS